jgi:hypothetical protein
MDHGAGHTWITDFSAHINLLADAGVPGTDETAFSRPRMVLLGGDRSIASPILTLDSHFFDDRAKTV